MEARFNRHYSLEEARRLLPSVRKWLSQLRKAQRAAALAEGKLALLPESGHDLGGSAVNTSVRAQVGMREALAEFVRREIQVKDLDRGLVDFPAIKNGREIFLCWEEGEPDIEFWHGVDAGYPGREKL